MKKRVVVTLLWLMVLYAVAIAGDYLMKSGQDGPFYDPTDYGCFINGNGEDDGFCRRSVYYEQLCTKTSVQQTCTDGQRIDGGVEYGACVSSEDSDNGFICVFELE